VTLSLDKWADICSKTEDLTHQKNHCENLKCCNAISDSKQFQMQAVSQNKHQNALSVQAG